MDEAHNTRSLASVEHMAAEHTGAADRPRLDRIHPAQLDFEHQLDHAVLNDLGHSHDPPPGGSPAECPDH